MSQLIRRIGWLQLLAVLLIVPGSVLLPVAGWIVGIMLVWSSGRWSRSDKLAATFVWPGGLGLIGALGLVPAARGGGTCADPAVARPECPPAGDLGISPPLAIFAIVVLGVLPLLVAWRLLRNAYGSGGPPAAAEN